MNRKYKYTFLTLLLGTAFMIGSMLCMRWILEVRERQLLTENGKAAVESPVRAWQEWEKKEQTANHKLTIEQMEEAIQFWNNRIGETIHDPVEGQISMEEAIELGKQWLTIMGEKKQIYSITATLSAGYQRESPKKQLEPYYSFWTIEFSNQTVRTTLYLNAVTGQVWSAKIIWNDDIQEKLYPQEQLKIFIESAGLQAENKTEVTKDDYGMQAHCAVKNSLLYAQVSYQRVDIEEGWILKYYVYDNNENLFDSYGMITYNFFTNKRP